MSSKQQHEDPTQVGLWLRSRARGPARGRQRGRGLGRPAYPHCGTAVHPGMLPLLLEINTPGMVEINTSRSPCRPRRLQAKSLTAQSPSHPSLRPLQLRSEVPPPQTPMTLPSFSSSPRISTPTLEFMSRSHTAIRSAKMSVPQRQVPWFCTSSVPRLEAMPGTYEYSRNVYECKAWRSKASVRTKVYSEKTA